MNAEEIQKIVNEAPEGARYTIDNTQVYYTVCAFKNRDFFYKYNEGEWWQTHSTPRNIRSLDDLREILQLRTLLEQVTRAADVVLEKWKQGDVDVSYIYALEEARANAGALTDENE